MFKPIVAIALVLGFSGSALAGDRTHIWPGKLTCRGDLIQTEVLTYELKFQELEDNVWCNAMIDHKDESRVLAICKVGDYCEIKGIVDGHGSFYWYKITSIAKKQDNRGL